MAFRQKMPLLRLLNIEKARILDALTNTNWNQAKAAKALGITQRQMGYKIQKYEIKQTA